ncbi:MAG: AI-2E family transporter [Actinomycetes bacterium]
MAKLIPHIPGIPGMKKSAKAAPQEDFGTVGAPLDQGHPFYFGFLAASGAVIAITLLRALASASQVFVLILISLFLAAGLNPAVNFFQRRGIRRVNAVALIVAIVIGFVALFALVAIPPIVDQLNLLVKNAPSLISSLKNNHTINQLNQNYGVIDSIQKKVTSSIHDGQFVVTAFGGVLGVGKAVISGVFAVLTILVLTLYFLASLPAVTSVAYRFVPASRRARVAGLSDAIIERVGIFVGGQATVSLIAAIYILIVGFIIRMPYTTALSLLVFFCGLIPLIGHILGVSIVTLMALTKSPTTAIIAFIAYVVYVQVENYVIMPRIMRKSLSIPGIVTIIAALIGTSLLGLVGGLLAVPIAAAVLLIVDEVVFPKNDLA